MSITNCTLFKERQVWIELQCCILTNKSEKLRLSLFCFLFNQCVKSASSCIVHSFKTINRDFEIKYVQLSRTVLLIITALVIVIIKVIILILQTSQNYDDEVAILILLRWVQQSCGEKFYLCDLNRTAVRKLIF